MWPNPGFLGRLPPPGVAGFTKNYALACFDSLRNIPDKSGGTARCRNSGAARAAVAGSAACLARVFNDYDFGGYLIANGVATFIDGRTELYGKKFFVDDIATIHLRKQDALHTIEPAVDVKAK
jgi:hypothetical protein